MTLTKNSTNYNVQDKIGDVNVNGTVTITVDGTVTINVNTDNGGYGSFTRNNEGFINFNSSFNEANDLIDYMQSLVRSIFQELGNNQ